MEAPIFHKGSLTALSGFLRYAIPQTPPQPASIIRLSLFSFSLFLPPPLFLDLSLTLSLPHFLSLSLTFSLPYSLFLYFSLSPSLLLSLYFSLISIHPSFSHFFFPLSLFPSISLSLPLPLLIFLLVVPAHLL